MNSRSRVWIIFMITLAIILAQVNLVSSQTIVVGRPLTFNATLNQLTQP